MVTLGFSKTNGIIFVLNIILLIFIINFFLNNCLCIYGLFTSCYVFSVIVEIDDQTEEAVILLLPLHEIKMEPQNLMIDLDIHSENR